MCESLFKLIIILAILAAGQCCTITCHRDGKHPNPSNRNSYIQCQNGKPSLLRCELSGDGVNRKRFDGNQCVEWFDCPKPNGRFRFPNNEALFWSCDSGVAYLERCPPGRVFDGQACVEPFNCPALSGFFPDRHNTSQYYECCYGEPRINTCPKGYQFDAELRCIEAFVCPQANGRFRNIRNESQYYECTQEVPVLVKCPEKHIFNGIDRCIEKYMCPLGDGNFFNPQDPSNRTYYLCIAGQPSLQTCPYHYLFYGRECDEPFRCPQPDGRFKHPRNDSKYYICENSFPYPHTCPIDYEYDELKLTCAKAFKCPASFGKFTHPEDRSLYYECHNGRARVHRCPEESYFDGRDCVLNFRCPQRIGTFPHPTHPNKYYYCREGVATLQECPIDYLYDTYRKTCIKKDEVFKCPQPEGLFPNPHNDRIFYVCVENIPSVRECAVNQKFDRQQKTCVDINSRIDNHCPQPDGVFRDLTDESRYYHCRGGVAHLRECGPNRRFDETLRTCFEVFRCPAIPGLYPHPTNSSRFYECFNGVPHLRECPYNQVFDERRGICMGHQPRPPVFICPESEGMFPNPTNDSQFYYCRQNTPHLSECPSGQVFKPLYRRCVPKVYPFVCPRPEGLFPHPESENRYYQCLNNIPYLRDCGRNQLFDRTYGRCVDNDLEKCQCPEPNGMFAYPYNRRRYYLCRQNMCQIRECAVNEVFDAQFHRCVDRHNPSHQCPQPNGLFRHETNSSQYYVCRDGRSQLHECPQHYIFSEEERQCIPWSWPNSFYCPVANGQFTNPQNQSQYFECCRGVATLRSCPPNQIFNGEYCISDVIYRCEDNYRPGQCQNGHRYQYSCPYQYGRPLVYNGYRCVEPYHCPNAHGVEIIVNPIHHHQYYRCTDGRPSLNTCSRGYVFDPRRGCCVYEHRNGYGDVPPQTRPVHPDYNRPTYPDRDRPSYPDQQRPVYPDQIRPGYPDYSRPAYPEHHAPGVPGRPVSPDEQMPEQSYVPPPPPPPQQEIHEVIWTVEPITLPEVVAQRKESERPSLSSTGSPVLRGDMNGDYDSNEKELEPEDNDDYNGDDNNDDDHEQ